MTVNANRPGSIILAQRPTIGPIEMDCTISEVHGDTFTFNDEPMEDGTKITDLRVKDPVVLDLEGIISPLSDRFNGLRQPAQARQKAEDFQTAWSRLRAYAADDVPSEVITELEVYPDMLPVSFSHTEMDEGLLRFTMRLRQIQVARVRRDQFVSPDFEDRVTGGDDRGQQGTKELSDSELDQVTGFQQVTEVAA